MGVSATAKPDPYSTTKANMSMMSSKQMSMASFNSMSRGSSARKAANPMGDVKSVAKKLME